MRRFEQTLENDEVPHAGNIFKALICFVKHRTLDGVLNLHTWDTIRYSRLLLQSGIMHILETYQPKKEGHKPRTRGEICKPTNIWFQHKSDYGWAGNSYRSCATRGRCHHSGRENFKISYEFNGLCVRQCKLQTKRETKYVGGRIVCYRTPSCWVAIYLI